MARFNTQDQFVFELLDQMQMQLDRHYYSMREAFLKVDTDRSGWLSKQEFNTILRMFNINVKDKVHSSYTPVTLRCTLAAPRCIPLHSVTFPLHPARSWTH